MRTHWTTAALLSAALAVACGDRGTDNAQNPQENGGAAAVTEQPVEPAPPAPPAAPVVTPAAPPARTSENRTPAAPRSPAPARPSAAAPAPEPPPRPVVRTVTIPAGTALPLELTTAVSTETARVEMPVSARLRQDVVVGGRTAIPAGSVLDGEVIEVERPGRVQGRARLGLRFTSVTIGNTREDLRTNPVSFEGEATKSEDATKIGAGAGVGAVIGGILGGGDGAAKGAAIGGAAGTGAVLATRGRDLTLAAGTDVNATLASEIDVRVR